MVSLVWTLLDANRIPINQRSCNLSGLTGILTHTCTPHHNMADNLGHTPGRIQSRSAALLLGVRSCLFGRLVSNLLPNSFASLFAQVFDDLTTVLRSLAHVGRSVNPPQNEAFTY